MDAELLEIVDVLDPFALRVRWRSFVPDYGIPRAAPLDHVDKPNRVEDSYHLETWEPVDPPPPWNIAFSKRFQKDLDGLDRKLAGRVLEILLEVKDFALPFVAKGDTFKALIGELAGCWRYRVGDHRLILKPEEKLVQIVAMAFAARGSVYD